MTLERSDAASDYHMLTGVQKAQLGVVANLAYEFTPSQRLTFENFYTHSGRDEGRFFSGDQSRTTPVITRTPGYSSSKKA